MVGNELSAYLGTGCRTYEEARMLAAKARTASLVPGGTRLTEPASRASRKRSVRRLQRMTAAIVVLSFPLVLFAFGVTSVVEIAIDVGAGLATAMIALLIESRDRPGPA